jgi:transcriptional regulator with PAS, ATPase and Fis domain
MSTRDTIKQRFSIVGDSPRLNSALDVAMKIAPTEVTVLVIGENGTGKDVFSRIIHQLSTRKHKPLIAINCGAIPEGTIDSELFGHEKGSFTSAYDARKGYFEEANGGLIFMDEIAEMPLTTQSRLLRVLENGEYLRVGSSKVQKTDVRVVAATNKNLLDAIRKAKFREDLYFRLNTVTIYVPPLRERGGDIELLFRHFATEFAERYGREQPIGLGDEARQLLYQYRWPGNVRELRNFVEKVTVLHPKGDLAASQMQEYLQVQDNLLPTLYEGNPIGNEPSSSTYSNNIGSDENVMRTLYRIESELSELKKLFFGYLSTQFGRGMAVTEPYTNGSDDGLDSVPVLAQRPVMPSGYVAPTSLPAMPYTTSSYTPEIQSTAPPTRQLEESLSLEMKEKDMIIRALAKYKKNRKKAAAELGISERTLYRKIKTYGLDNLL